MTQKKAHAYVMSLTPFNEVGDLDEEGFRKHLRRMAGAGVGLYVAGSGSGEAHTYRTGEMERVLSIAKEEVPENIRLYMNGFEPRDSGGMARVASFAHGIGYQGIQVPGPDVGHGYKPSDREIREYYSEVLATGAPIILMSHGHLGYLVPLPALEWLVNEHKNIVGINCATNDSKYLAAAIKIAGQRSLPFCVGGPELAFNAFCLGATGFLTTHGNLAPQLAVAFADAFSIGDFERFVKMCEMMLKLAVANSKFSNIVGIKAALRAYGLPGGWPRSPRLSPPDQNITQFLDELDEIGVSRLEGFTRS